MIKKFLLLISDIAILYLSLVITLFIRYGHNFEIKYDIHVAPFSVIFVVWLLIFYISNFYDIKSLRNNATFYSNLLKSIIIASVVSIAFFYLVPIFGITPKTNLFIFCAVFTILEIGNRSITNRLMEKSLKNSLLIVGLNNKSLELAKFIKDNPQLGYELKYFIDSAPETLKQNDNDFQRFGIIQGIENIEKIINAKEINTVVISPEAYEIPELVNIFYKSLERRISFYDLPSFYEQVMGKIPLGIIDYVWFIENFSEGRKKIYEISKRLIDIIFSIVMGVVSLVVYPFVIPAIKLSSAGPLFYKQKRVGKLGKTFEIIKFRTMHNDAEERGAVWATPNDPRITAVGKFLRTSRLDELPQLWNILKGEMSFVGPRAERPEFHEELKKAVPFYEERYLIKPGLTGWAQINFRYGSSIEDTREKLKYDLYYIKNRSFMLDIGIILKTIRIALQQEGR